MWALLNWKDGAPRARLALADERLPLNERMDALVVLQRNAELDMALCREIARRGGKLGELAAVSARRIAEAGSAPTPK